MYKRIKCFFLLLLISIGMAGCSNNVSESEELDYIVVKTDESFDIEETFRFESVSKYSLSGEVSKLGIAQGCYSVGTLADGNFIVWRSDDDKTGYDDCLFVYVEDASGSAQTIVMKYAARLKEDPVSYDEFQEIYQ